MSAALAVPHEHFRKMLQVIRTVDSRLVEQSEVCAFLALDRTYIHRFIHDGQAPSWLSFGGRRRFWRTDDVDAVERALVARYSGALLREVVDDIQRERLAMLRRFANLIRSIAATEAGERTGPLRDRRLLTFDEVCEPDKPFSLVRLDYSRRHLDNLRAQRRFPIAVVDEPGDLLRVDVLAVALHHVQVAIDNLTARSTSGSEQQPLATRDLTVQPSHPSSPSASETRTLPVPSGSSASVREVA